MVNDDNTHRLPQYVRNLFQDPEAAKYVAGMGVHWYENDLTDMDRLVRTHQLYPNKFVLSTEVSCDLL